VYDRDKIVTNSIAEIDPLQNLYLEVNLVDFDICARVSYLVIFVTHFLEFKKKYLFGFETVSILSGLLAVSGLLTLLAPKTAHV
jgi:hypothetical protein